MCLTFFFFFFIYIYFFGTEGPSPSVREMAFRPFHQFGRTTFQMKGRAALLYIYIYYFIYTFIYLFNL
jgi:hypothetical protein